MTIVLGILVFATGLALIAWGTGQAALFYAGRMWFDRQLAGDYTQMARDEIERIIGQVPNAFVRKHIVERLKNYGGKLLVSMARGELTRMARIGLLLLAVGLVLCVSAFNTGALIEWSRSFL